MPVHVAYARRPLARKNTPVRLTALGAEEFEGYASLFDRPDGAGDVVAPGAFSATLRRRGADGIRMLYQHFAHAPIGVWDEIRETGRGLHVRGHLVRDVEQARDVRALLAAGALNGLSIGFRPARRQSRNRARKCRAVDVSAKGGGGAVTKSPRLLRDTGFSLIASGPVGRGIPRAVSASASNR